VLGGIMTVAVLAFVTLLSVDLAGEGDGGSESLVFQREGLERAEDVDSSASDFSPPVPDAALGAAPDAAPYRAVHLLAQSNSYALATQEAAKSKDPTLSADAGGNTGALRVGQGISAAIALTTGALALLAWRRAGA
jgi:hypothetical protein